MIILSHPLEKIIDGLKFKGHIIPSDFSTCQIRDEIEVANCFCDLCGAIVIKAKIGTEFFAQNIVSGSMVALMTEFQKISLLQALMCADISYSYLELRIKQKPEFLLKSNAKSEFDSLHKRLLGDNLPNNIVKAVQQDVPFDLSWQTKVVMSKSQFHLLDQYAIGF